MRIFVDCYSLESQLEWRTCGFSDSLARLVTMAPSNFSCSIRERNGALFISGFVQGRVWDLLVH